MQIQFLEKAGEKTPSPEMGQYRLAEDGWFRTTRNNYGLPIKYIKRPHLQPDYSSFGNDHHKVIVGYLNWEGVEKQETAWISVPEGKGIQQFLAYIEDEKSNWIP